ncbi:FCD domain-containing protein [Pseudovibrio exalbescens]|uniref:Transcriptional regulator n=1 Tax=Pseudovibrio exalbescens TaxID=197461 RepID=A0A1U7JGC8_9HYPH|nr:FCD domain-containing protein [Pseudovibrio exalbescens]OKL43800.1 transcriptional regulator [Pseudovibrio exalbescens]
MTQRRLYQSIAEDLKNKIAEGEYPVGSKLPPERVIAQDFGISRTVVREAVIMLEIEGIVSVRKGSGIQVISTNTIQMDSGNSRTETALRLLLSEMEKAGPFEMLQARQMVECMIVELAAKNITNEDIAELEAIQLRAQHEDRARDSSWDRDFHIRLAEATGNSVLAVLVQLMWEGRSENPLWKNLHSHIEEKDLNSWCAEHQLIMDALIARDPASARKAMWAHIESTKEALYNASSALGDMYDEDPVASGAI